MKVKKMIIKIKNKIEKIYVRYSVTFSKYEYGLNTSKRDIPIIVSLTTFPKRINQLELCFKSILLQSIKPDKIIVWLGSDCNKNELSPILSKYEKYGFTFKYDEKKDYKSHKKYIYAFNEYKNSIIITLDDDLIYPKDIIFSLLKKYEKYPNCVVARRVHKITFNENGEINKYNKWVYECFNEKKPNHLLLATTGAGTLYPPNIMPDIATDFSIIENNALTSDDIWLKFVELKYNIKTVWAGDSYQMPETVEKNQEVSLNSVNVFQNINDINIKKLVDFFSIKKNDFYK